MPTLPEQYADVVRPESIHSLFDENNKVLEMDADGILATCIRTKWTTSKASCLSTTFRR